MTKALVFIITGLLCPVLVLSGEQSDSKETIKWALPSGYTNPQTSEIKEQGRDEWFIDLVQKSLTEYTHQNFSANIHRILMQVQNSTNTCSGSSLGDRSRLAYAYWTPYAILPSPLLVIRKGLAAKIKLVNDKVSLRELLKNKSLHGAAGISRSFGPELDPLLKEFKDGTIKREAFDFIPENLLEMIANKRFDYTIEHAFVLKKVSETTRKQLVTLPILEATQPLKTYFICSRSAFGKTVITKIDTVIRKAVNDPAYVNKMLMNAAPKDIDPEFEGKVRQFIKDRAKSSQVE